VQRLVAFEGLAHAVDHEPVDLFGGATSNLCLKTGQIDFESVLFAVEMSLLSIIVVIVHHM
jgi:hypothetical protein